MLHSLNANTTHNYCKLNSRFLPEMELIDGVTIIKATYGTGKTELIARYLDNNPNESVLYIAHLITLCEQAASRLNIECYNNPDEELHKQKRLSICINSIYKLFTEPTNKPSYSIVVIDEIEQLLSRLGDNGKEAIQSKSLVLSCLKHFIAKAKKVICLDADISKITMEFMAGCRPDEQFNVITNEYRHSKKLYVYSSEAEVMRLAKTAIAKGDPVLFATNSIKKSKEIFTQIDSPNKRLINSQTSSSAENKHFMADVNSNCKNDLLTVISPSLSTGFSIEAGHYQWNLGRFSYLVNTPLDCLQQLERDRVNTDKHVFISPGNKPYKPKMVKQAHDFNMMHIDGYGEIVYFDAVYSDLVNNINTRNVQLKSNFKASFIREAEAKGYEVVLVSSTMTVEELAEYKAAKQVAKEAIAEKRVEAICNAKPLNEPEYEALQRKGGSTEEQSAQLQRYELEVFYQTEVSPELVEQDDNGKLRQQLKNLKLAITPFDEVKELQLKNASGKFIEDVNYLTVKHLLFAKVLQAVGISTDLTLSRDYYTENELVRFIDWLENQRKLLVAIQPDLPSRIKIKSNPYRLMGSLLKTIGLSQSRVKGKENGKSICLGYRIEAESLERGRFVLLNEDPKENALTVR